jgi:hypothetical protein
MFMYFTSEHLDSTFVAMYTSFPDIPYTSGLDGPAKEAQYPKNNAAHASAQKFRYPTQAQAEPESVIVVLASDSEIKLLDHVGYHDDMLWPL